MPATRADLLARLEDLGLATETIDHAPVFTVEEAKVHRGDLSGGHIKNLFLKDKKGGLWLVVCMEDRRVDMNALSKRLGAPRFSFGKPELLMDVLGVEPGSVTPFAVINDGADDSVPRVTLVLDEELLNHDPVNCHPLVNTATTRIAPDALLRFCRATGHEPIISTIDERQD
ncbi:MAG: prolyl-tRNA synthetase associated domain-containing protein [Minwuia sp.]|nr:prolyl-tRNA synthetase associated domain-containing protein [Minwuia sp.]